MTRTEETETRGYCSWSEERSMLANDAVKQTSARCDVLSARFVSHTRDIISFITPYSTLL